MKSISDTSKDFFLLILGLFLIQPSAYASSIHLDSLQMVPHAYFGYHSADISDKLSVLRERDGSFTFENINSYQSQFVLNNDDLDISPDDTYWVHFEILSPRDTSETILLELGRERISTWWYAEAYSFHADTLTATMTTGMALSPQDKNVRNAHNLVEVPIKPGVNTIYAKIKGHYLISDNPKWKSRYNYFRGHISFYIHDKEDYFAFEEYKYPGHFIEPKRGFIFSSNYIKQCIEVVAEIEEQYDITQIRSVWDTKAVYLYDYYPTPHNTYWLRYKVVGTNQSIDHLMGLSSGTHWNFDRAEIYTVEDQKITSTQLIGNAVSLSKKATESLWNVFKVRALPGDTTTIYMKLSGAGKRFIPELSITHIDESTFWPRIFNVQLIYGAFFGILIVQALYFFILGFIEKEALHGWFVCLIVGFGLALGFVGADVNFFIFPSLEEYHPWLTGIGTFMMVLGLYKYIDIFLSLKNILPWHPNYAITPLLIIHGLICLVFAFKLESIGGNIAVFELYFQLIFASCVFNFLIGILLGIYAWIKGSRDAKFFVGAFAALVFIFVIRLMFAFGSFDGEEGFQQSTILLGLYIHYILFLGIILTSILLGFSNGYRINRLKIAQMQSDARAQEAQKMNAVLSEKNHLIETRSAEKDFLLKEVHHRVKNNLQILSSLLSLQSDSENDNSIINALQEGRNRVDAIGLIHQHLYSQDLLESIDMSIYLEDLCTYLKESFEGDLIDIDIIPNVTVQSADVETAIPIGLIVNELITNSLKYAFNNQSKGRIDVNLEINKDKLLVLTVKDNGNSSTQQNIHIHRSTQFGSKLVSLLSQKLKGTVSENTTDGYETKILFERYNCT